MRFGGPHALCLPKSSPFIHCHQVSPFPEFGPKVNDMWSVAAKASNPFA